MTAAEDREKAAQAVADAADSAWGVLTSKPPMEQDYLAVDALIAAGWGPGGVSVRPDREALAQAIAEAWSHGADVPQGEFDGYLADALLAVEHLWATPDAAQPLAERSQDPEQKAVVVSDGSQGEDMGHLSLAKAMHRVYCGDQPWDDDEHESGRAQHELDADELLASGVVQDRATVEREAAAKALEAAASALRGEFEPLTNREPDWRNAHRVLIEAAAEYREGRR